MFIEDALSMPKTKKNPLSVRILGAYYAKILGEYNAKTNVRIEV